MVLELLYVILKFEGESEEETRGKEEETLLERQKAMEALVKISEKSDEHVEHVQERMLPGLLKGALGSDRATVVRSLETLGMLCDLPEIFDAVWVSER